MSAQPNNWPALLRFEDVDIGRTQVIVHTVTEAEVNAFGRLSGDLNPLHMEDAFAECSPFGRRVVHGLLTAAPCPRLIRNSRAQASLMSGRNCAFSDRFISATR